jgi:hypothetical protein
MPELCHWLAELGYALAEPCRITEGSLGTKEQNPDYGFVYSGLRKVEDESGHYIQAPHFNGRSGNVI